MFVDFVKHFLVFILLHLLKNGKIMFFFFLLDVLVYKKESMETVHEVKKNEKPFHQYNKYCFVLGKSSCSTSTRGLLFLILFIIFVFVIALG